MPSNGPDNQASSSKVMRGRMQTATGRTNGCTPAATLSKAEVLKCAKHHRRVRITVATSQSITESGHGPRERTVFGCCQRWRCRSRQMRQQQTVERLASFVGNAHGTVVPDKDENGVANAYALVFDE
jgi:hypothetical protein